MVSNTKLSSVTMNELAMKDRERIQLFRVSIKQQKKEKTNINPNGIQITNTC